MSSYSPELIQDCKQTQLLRLHTRVVGLTNQPRKQSTKIVNITLAVTCVLCVIFGLTYLAFDPIVRTVILNKLVLTNTSQTFFLWESPPIIPHLKVYFFNLTNPDEVFNGISKPRLLEVGPYVYHQKWIKQNISWHTNGTISFKTRKVFTFIPSLSCAACDELNDRITTLNVPALAAYHQMRDANWFSRGVLSQVISAMDYQPWVVKSPIELIWGYEEKLFDLAKLVAKPPPFEQFGFFFNQKSTGKHLGLYTMYTGMDNPYNLSNIALFNGNKQLNFWKTDQCNKVHGSDGSSFHPYISDQDTLWFFNDQMCRAVPLVFDQHISQQGLPGLRFKPREDVFMSSSKYPDNTCFESESRVNGDGVFDLTDCQFNTPIVLSWPHFLDAEDKYRNSVEGLSPNRSIHGFWFDVQSVTGTTMSAKARIQINLSVKRSEGFDHLSKVNDTVVPILWFEEGIDGLGVDLIDLLKQAAVDPGVYKQSILYCLVGIGSLSFLLIVTAVMIRVSNRAAAANVDHIRDQVADILDPSGHKAEDQETARQPMLGSSAESSRSSSASHSRTSSEGQTPPYAVLNLEDRLEE